MALLSSAKHQSLVDAMNTRSQSLFDSESKNGHLLPEARGLCFGLSQSRLQLLLCHLKIPDVSGSWNRKLVIVGRYKIMQRMLTAIQQGHLA